MNFPLGDVTSFLIIMGIALMILDVMILGAATLYLTIIGIGCLVTAGLVEFGHIDSASWLQITLSVALFSAAFTATSWKSLKRLQNNGDDVKKAIPNDMVGTQFYLDQDLAAGKPVSQRYSGVNWKVEASEDYPAGTLVTIKECHVGRLVVAKEV